ncbi:TfoX/Sxy family DNA transformation protein [Aliiroseovarius sp. KMU-50]|uniref:TfoX/Sxy family DNA transformation protein n=1 Tax=Aliiroseovarius salicola TaxID=3009082 RepID=A0ABT4W1V8_9RHOB|nr:TfoX/Sxy family DNA transformation protein [Aliiroseovarius sp. KMU-50]MDA5094493.1 TfoX/Sxy family DNA transformation protein [Aliiroseovarius sp. KMU-50]
MADPVSSIRNLGPASDEAFARAGIDSADELRNLGPDEAYFRLLDAGHSPHFIGYYAMVMGLQGRPWNDCQGKEKAALRKRFDKIKTRVAAGVMSDLAHDAAFEKIMDEIGVRPTR